MRRILLANQHPFTIDVFQENTLVFSTELESSLEFGRQREGEHVPYVREGDRVIIAQLDETDVSRQHLLLSIDSEQGVRVENQSTVATVVIHPDRELDPGESVVVHLPCLLVLFGRTIKLTKAENPDAIAKNLESLAQKTLPPGQSSSASSRLSTILKSGRDENETDLILRGLEATIGVLQHAGKSDEFSTLALGVMVDELGFEKAAALSCDGGTWRVDTCRTRAGQPQVEWTPSQAILKRVLDERRTFWRFSDVDESTTSSLVNAGSLIATPVLSRDGQVVGALYGERPFVAQGQISKTMSEAEASIVELLSTSVAAGIARLEQERSAVKARVLFEQFFTPELSRQIEIEPGLLLGKDAIVTLVFCDIRGFSQATEQLGARLTLDWINDVMGTLSQCDGDNQGVLVDALGDELLGMWGAPAVCPDQAELACRAAIQMQEQIPQLNRRWRKVLDRPMELGIGIHTGTARVGNIGSPHKFKYGPLGSTVQIARQAQQATRQLKCNILITTETASRLDSSFTSRRLRTNSDEQPVGLHELAIETPDDWLKLKRLFESAVGAYERDDLPTAIRLLAKVLVDHPGDLPALQLLSRIADTPQVEP